MITVSDFSLTVWAVGILFTVTAVALFSRFRTAAPRRSSSPLRSKAVEVKTTVVQGPTPNRRTSALAAPAPLGAFSSSMPKKSTSMPGKGDRERSVGFSPMQEAHTTSAVFRNSQRVVEHPAPQLAPLPIMSVVETVPQPIFYTVPLAPRPVGERKARPKRSTSTGKRRRDAVETSNPQGAPLPYDDDERPARPVPPNSVPVSQAAQPEINTAQRQPAVLRPTTPLKKDTAKKRRRPVTGFTLYRTPSRPGSSKGDDGTPSDEESDEGASSDSTEDARIMALLATTSKGTPPSFSHRKINKSGSIVLFSGYKGTGGAADE